MYELAPGMECSKSMLAKDNIICRLSSVVDARGEMLRRRLEPRFLGLFGRSASDLRSFERLSPAADDGALGWPAAVLLSPEEFDRLTVQARFVRGVQEGHADLDAGRVVGDDELGRRLDAPFGRLKKPQK